MGIINPNLTGTASHTTTPTDVELAVAEDKAVPVTKRDYPSSYKLLIILNTILWIAYLMGWLK